MNEMETRMTIIGYARVSTDGQGLTSRRISSKMTAPIDVKNKTTVVGKPPKIPRKLSKAEPLCERNHADPTISCWSSI